MTSRSKTRAQRARRRARQIRESQRQGKLRQVMRALAGEDPYPHRPATDEELAAEAAKWVSRPPLPVGWV